MSEVACSCWYCLLLITIQDGASLRGGYSVPEVVYDCERRGEASSVYLTMPTWPNVYLPRSYSWVLFLSEVALR